MAGNQKRFWRFQLTAARRRLGAEAEAKAKAERVSTHSRPKAAGAAVINTEMIHESFNSQPPEGGWKRSAKAIATLLKFQLTAARRRLVFSP